MATPLITASFPILVSQHHLTDLSYILGFPFSVFLTWLMIFPCCLTTMVVVLPQYIYQGLLLLKSPRKCVFLKITITWYVHLKTCKTMSRDITMEFHMHVYNIIIYSACIYYITSLQDPLIKSRSHTSENISLSHPPTTIRVGCCPGVGPGI